MRHLKMSPNPEIFNWDVFGVECHNAIMQIL